MSQAVVVATTAASPHAVVPTIAVSPAVAVLIAAAILAVARKDTAVCSPAARPVRLPVGAASPPVVVLTTAASRAAVAPAKQPS